MTFNRHIRKAINKVRGRMDVDAMVKQGLRLGNNVSISSEASIDPSCCWLISIGDNCTLTPGVRILAHDASTKRHIGYTKIGRVSIGDQTFIGAGSIVLPGVEIGANVIIGAGSVVRDSIPDGKMAVGNPAVVVTSTTDYVREHRARMKTRPCYPKEGWTVEGKITEKNKAAMLEELKDFDIAYIE
jgi:maltose O-acetyltransferase